MLPGNGTILLETIANINSSLKSNKFYAKSNVILSLIQQLQSTLGKIIKICDDALISEAENDFIALNKENINELVVQLHEGVNVSCAVIARYFHPLTISFSQTESR
jgi:Rap guanine nucleotide exchange factor 1